MGSFRRSTPAATPQAGGGRTGYPRYAANPEDSRNSYLANREIVLERTRERYLSDPDYWITKARNRRKRQQIVDLGDVDRNYLSRAFNDCYLCGGPLAGSQMQFDHIVPLTRGGMHCRENLRPTHARCNLRKSSRLLSELSWYAGPTGLGVVARMICA